LRSAGGRRSGSPAGLPRGARNRPALRPVRLAEGERRRGQRGRGAPGAPVGVRGPGGRARSGRAGPRLSGGVPPVTGGGEEVPGHDIQGNVLRGYPLDHAAHVFLAVAPGAGAGARRLLRDILPRVTTGAPWPLGHRPVRTLNIAFTFGGLTALAGGRAWLEALPED